MMEGLKQRMIPADGATLEVFVGGTGEPVVCRSYPCIDALTDLATGWGTILPAGTFIGVNPRGVGHSSGHEPADFTFRQHVDDLEAVRRRLGIERWVFWGSSAGGAIALLYALYYPEALSGVIVTHMGPTGQSIFADSRSDFSPNHPTHQRNLAKDSVLARNPAVLGSLFPRLVSAEWLHLQHDRWILTQDNRPSMVVPGEAERYFERAGAPTARWQATIEEIVLVYDVQDRLGDIKVPTLIVAGRQDQTIPMDYCELLHTGIPHAEFAVFEESGHDIDPASADGERYRATVNSFLARHADKIATG